MRLVEEIGFAQAFSVKYSARPGTPAAAMKRRVPERVAAERLGRLQALLGSQQASFDRATIGRRLPVLRERRGRHAGQLVGRTPYLQAVHLQADVDTSIGDLVTVDITGRAAHSLAGRLAPSAAPDAAARVTPPHERRTA